MGSIDTFFERLHFSEVVIANSEGVAGLTGINRIGTKVKGSSQHREAACWSEKFWNLSHGSILILAEVICSPLNKSNPHFLSPNLRFLWFTGHYSSTMVLRNTPIDSISISQISPAFIKTGGVLA